MVVNKNGTKTNESFILYVLYVFSANYKPTLLQCTSIVNKKETTFSVLDKGVLRKKRLSRIKRKCTEKSTKRQSRGHGEK